MFNILVQFPIGFFIALSGVLMPGPLFAYVVAKSSEYGARTGPQVVVGHVLVELVMLALIAFGLGIVLQSNIFQIGLGLVGGVLLIVLGVISVTKLLRSFRSPKMTVVTKYHPVLGGAMFSTILNPSVIIWWAAIGLATIMESYLVASYLGVVFWLFGHFLADLTWFSLVSLSAARGRKMLGARGYRILLLTCSLVLLVLGIYFIAKYGLLL